MADYPRPRPAMERRRSIDPEFHRLGVRGKFIFKRISFFYFSFFSPQNMKLAPYSTNVILNVYRIETLLRWTIDEFNLSETNEAKLIGFLRLPNGLKGCDILDAWHSMREERPGYVSNIEFYESFITRFPATGVVAAVRALWTSDDNDNRKWNAIYEGLFKTRDNSNHHQKIKDAFCEAVLKLRFSPCPGSFLANQRFNVLGPILFQAGFCPAWRTRLKNALRTVLGKSACYTDSDEDACRLRNELLKVIPQSSVLLRESLKADAGVLICKGLVAVYTKSDYTESLPDFIRETFYDVFDELVRGNKDDKVSLRTQIIRKPYFSCDSDNGEIWLNFSEGTEGGGIELRQKTDFVRTIIGQARFLCTQGEFSFYEETRISWGKIAWTLPPLFTSDKWWALFNDGLLVTSKTPQVVARKNYSLAVPYLVAKENQDLFHGIENNSLGDIVFCGHIDDLGNMDYCLCFSGEEEKAFTLEYKGVRKDFLLKREIWINFETQPGTFRGESQDGYLVFGGKSFPSISLFIPCRPDLADIELCIFDNRKEAILKQHTLSDRPPKAGFFDCSPLLSDALNEIRIPDGLHFIELNVSTKNKRKSFKFWFWKGLKKIDENGFILVDDGSAIINDFDLRFVQNIELATFKIVNSHLPLVLSLKEDDLDAEKILPKFRFFNEFVSVERISENGIRTPFPPGEAELFWGSESRERIRVETTSSDDIEIQLVGDGPVKQLSLLRPGGKRFVERDLSSLYTEWKYGDDLGVAPQIVVLKNGRKIHSLRLKDVAIAEINREGDSSVFTLRHQEFLKNNETKLFYRWSPVLDMSLTSEWHPVYTADNDEKTDWRISFDRSSFDIPGADLKDVILEFSIAEIGGDCRQFRDVFVASQNYPHKLRLIRLNDKVCYPDGINMQEEEINKIFKEFHFIFEPIDFLPKNSPQVSLRRTFDSLARNEIAKKIFKQEKTLQKQDLRGLLDRRVFSLSNSLSGIFFEQWIFIEDDVPHPNFSRKDDYISLRKKIATFRNALLVSGKHLSCIKENVCAKEYFVWALSQLRVRYEDFSRRNVFHILANTGKELLKLQTKIFGEFQSIAWELSGSNERPHIDDLDHWEELFFNLSNLSCAIYTHTELHKYKAEINNLFFNESFCRINPDNPEVFRLFNLFEILFSVTPEFMIFFKYFWRNRKIG